MVSQPGNNPCPLAYDLLSDSVHSFVSIHNDKSILFTMCGHNVHVHVMHITLTNNTTMYISHVIQKTLVVGDEDDRNMYRRLEVKLRETSW